MGTLNLTLKIWRQDGLNKPGGFKNYKVDGLNTHMSFLEMLDVLNEQLVNEDSEPVAFDHDCREGICGMCSMVIDGRPHGLLDGTTTCQLHMRFFNDGDTITIEPWRAKPFPIIKDLIVDRTPLDRIIQAGGYVSINTGSAPDGNVIPISKEISEDAFDAAACIGCGACVAACKNASASLFTAAKISQLALLPQGQAERKERVIGMVQQMDKEGFGHCTNTEACEAECPQGISVEYIRKMNWEYHCANIKG
ncbi:MAG: succinate dehydrogenase/fumarate reductase iron-sulfur subunit [Candidatus Marinimicrobia bacterium]|jgi:succinate dehydrogenase / fumarate reductase iron-sulfur subunit|nr:succinate dehydrogenase/fumarate reductase iron-sulfur subunit [Candidatus Neomarinimicrobiota bacterium]MBT3838376.1 succinate dehydrogenase/fumarate reductase iron-sulfur subunit [Candidatus Neomarinimicrobiota bacterium]MBT3998681.1 succinate dehydrogenase/fumarate reductase iron-sulfur subunit [Candidatus Neomarinimicrobiota bacterium]MBT4283260.1 succinate dehydrogenase/fumarate reductase iron-sulfur subunit [Candidatus Neomarinimicrobiota bacterium]MBT4578427.1 succinate dehydrogenase/